MCSSCSCSCCMKTRTVMEKKKKKKRLHQKKNKKPFIFSLSCLSGEGEELPAKVQYILGKCIFQFWYVWLFRRISELLAATGRH